MIDMVKLSRLFHIVRLFLSGLFTYFMVKSASVLSELQRYDLMKLQVTAEELGVMDFADTAGALYLYAVFFYFAVALISSLVFFYFIGIPKDITPDFVKWIVRDVKAMMNQDYNEDNESVEDEIYEN